MRRYTNDQIVTALQSTLGRVYFAAEKLGCPPSTIYRRAESSRRVAETIEHYSGRMVDTAETALHSALLDREAWAIKFTLQTLGRKRGYSERTRPGPRPGARFLWNPPIISLDRSGNPRFANEEFQSIYEFLDQLDRAEEEQEEAEASQNYSDPWNDDSPLWNPDPNRQNDPNTAPGSPFNPLPNSPPRKPVGQAVPDAREVGTSNSGSVRHSLTYGNGAPRPKRPLSAQEAAELAEEEEAEREALTRWSVPGETSPLPIFPEQAARWPDLAATMPVLMPDGTVVPGASFMAIPCGVLGNSTAPNPGPGGTDVDRRQCPGEPGREASSSPLIRQLAPPTHHPLLSHDPTTRPAGVDGAPSCHFATLTSEDVSATRDPSTPPANRNVPPDDSLTILPMLLLALALAFHVARPAVVEGVAYRGVESGERKAESREWQGSRGRGQGSGARGQGPGEEIRDRRSEVRFPHPARRDSFHDPLSTIHDPRFSILDPPSSTSPPPPNRFQIAANQQSPAICNATSAPRWSAETGARGRGVGLKIPHPPATFSSQLSRFPSLARPRGGPDEIAAL